MTQLATLVHGLPSAQTARGAGRRVMTAPPTLLVVDDDVEIRDALADVLGDEGYSAVTRPGGHEALSYLRQGHRPTVIILDLWMPRMDGWVLRRELLADPALESIPVVVLTAATLGPAPPERIVGALGKPVVLGALLALLARAVGDP